MLAGVSLALLAGACGRATRTETSTLPSAPPAEQVCRLLADDEVRRSLSVDALVHTPAVPGPRACAWTSTGNEQPLVHLGLASRRWLAPRPAGDGLGPPCGQGSTVTTTMLGDRDAVHVGCLVDGLGVFVTAATSDRADVIDLTRLAVSRLGAIDRAAFGFDAEPEAGDSTGDTPSAPPECLEAWRAGRVAPPHCEEYPEAYERFLGE